MRWFKTHKILSSFLLIIACVDLLVVYLLVFNDGYLKCSGINPGGQTFYVAEQVVYDKDMLEGQFERIQDKKTAEKRNCFHIINGRVWKIEKEAIPSIIRVGTKQLKDPTLLSLASQLDFDGFTNKEPVSIYYVDDYTDFVWASGQYDRYKRAITVKSGADYQTQRTILAHEYLHYVWHRDGLSNDARLVNELNDFYDRSDTLKERMKSYEEYMISPTEFFSYGCTEWSGRLLTPYIIQKCEQYINRSKLQVYY